LNKVKAFGSLKKGIREEEIKEEDKKEKGNRKETKTIKRKAKGRSKKIYK